MTLEELWKVVRWFLLATILEALVKAASRLIITAVLLAAGIAIAAEPESNVLSFLAWKSTRVEEARLNLERAQLELGGAKGLTPTAGQKAGAPKSGRPDQKVQQAQLNLEIAQELSITDYFVIYLGAMKDRESLVEVAKKLTPEEVADLLTAYQKQISNGGPRELAVPAPDTLSGLAPVVAEKGVKAGM